MAGLQLLLVALDCLLYEVVSPVVILGYGRIFDCFHPRCLACLPIGLLVAWSFFFRVRMRMEPCEA